MISLGCRSRSTYKLKQPLNNFKQHSAYNVLHFSHRLCNFYQIFPSAQKIQAHVPNIVWSSQEVTTVCVMKLGTSSMLTRQHALVRVICIPLLSLTKMHVFAKKFNNGLR